MEEEGSDVVAFDRLSLGHLEVVTGTESPVPEDDYTHHAVVYTIVCSRISVTSYIR